MAPVNMRLLALSPRTDGVVKFEPKGADSFPPVGKNHNCEISPRNGLKREKGWFRLSLALFLVYYPLFP